ncbi:hypothetical protein FXE20_08680 [Vibrio cholerae]|uniref:hypothetical protein n=1 Tax=Vibrio cholerae TaxID=666 RepID=UPI0011D6C3DA|nr:hypothetical protein [Vibrio cholerae]EGR2426329.1 hypothetical protein [Vibrio cholerae]TXZ71904.1 hypothetical protein FXE20_08680 [Vibrio cholerae]GHZ80622.1 hypothetical protein VCSRO34_2432 [Vibrio cholerae]
MNNILKKIDELFDSITEYLHSETAYIVQRSVCSDYYVDTTEIRITSDDDVLASIKPIIYMMPIDDVYAQVEFSTYPLNEFSYKSISKLCKNQHGTYDFIDLEAFLEDVISGLEKSKQYLIDWHK